MHCSSCGKENPDSASFCTSCGFKLSSQALNAETAPALAPQSEMEFKKTNVILMFILIIVTCGIYSPVWYLRRRKSINKLSSEKKINTRVFIFCIVMLSVGLLLAFISGVAEGLDEAALSKGIDFFGNLINLIACIILLVQCFRVRSILHEHYTVNLKRDISFSKWGVFFFQILYLQYKINRL